MGTATLSGGVAAECIDACGWRAAITGSCSGSPDFMPSVAGRHGRRKGIDDVDFVEQEPGVR